MRTQVHSPRSRLIHIAENGKTICGLDSKHWIDAGSIIYDDECRKCGSAGSFEIVRRELDDVKVAQVRENDRRRTLANVLHRERQAKVNRMIEDIKNVIRREMPNCKATIEPVGSIQRRLVVTFDVDGETIRLEGYANEPSIFRCYEETK